MISRILAVALALVAVSSVVHGQAGIGGPGTGPGGISCYECNVYRGSVDGGIGVPCLPTPQQPIADISVWETRPNCTICVKFETWGYMNYQKPRQFNTYLTSHVVTRTCGDQYLRATNWCGTGRGNGAWVTQCYCNTNMCNGATSVRVGVTAALLSLAATLLAFSRTVY